MFVPMRYNKLFDLLESRGMKRKDLKDIMSEVTIAKLGKGEVVNTKVLCAICSKLHCDISDIAEYDYSKDDCIKQDMKNRRKSKYVV